VQIRSVIGGHRAFAMCCTPLLIARTLALVQPQPAHASALTRRQLAGSVLLAPAAALWAANGAGAPPLAHAAREAATLPVYFGCGCFWHVQHEFVELERSLLKRADLELSSRCGYAAGNRLGADGKVCYHNLRGIADYGKLGHAEAVAMRIPPSALPEFAKLYFSLFVTYNLLPGRTIYERADPQDAGPEYRSVLGLPGGVRSPYFPLIEAANAGKMKLVEVRAAAKLGARRAAPAAAPPALGPLTAAPPRRVACPALAHRARATSRTRCSSAPCT
jgi:peptide methionine sulfoxide reductase MsrA